MLNLTYTFRVDYDYKESACFNKIDKVITENMMQAKSDVSHYGGTPASSPYIEISNDNKEEAYKETKKLIFDIINAGATVE